MNLQAPLITRRVLADFAAASGDTNPLHLDPETAQAAGFDDVIAHGMLSMAWLGRLVTTIRPQQDLASFKVRFTALTPLGSRPEMTAQRTEDGTYDLRAQLEDGTVTMSGSATFRR